MTDRRVQELLDSMYYPYKQFVRTINKNESLSTLGRDKLFNIVRIVENEKNITKEFIDEQVSELINVILSFRERDSRKTLNAFLFKQIIFYLTIQYYYIKVSSNYSNNKNIRGNRIGKSSTYTQKDMLDTFEKKGVPLGHNYFTKLGYQPSWYVENRNYKQPANPCKYMGQKKNQYGIAIKELAYQAGSYKYYVDLFGGSGSASVALPHKKERSDIYNELSDRVRENLKRYTEKEICLRCIQEIVQLQNFLINGGDFLDALNLEDEWKQFESSCKGRGLQPKEVFPRYMSNEFVVVDNNKIMEFMIFFYKEISSYDDNWKIKVDNVVYTKQDVLAWPSRYMRYSGVNVNVANNTDDYIPAIAIMDFTTHNKVIKEILERASKWLYDYYYGIQISNENLEFILEEAVNEEEWRKKRTLFSYEEDGIIQDFTKGYGSVSKLRLAYMQERFYWSYIYYYNRRENAKHIPDETLMVAEIFMSALSTQNNVDNSMITNMVINDKTEYRKFLYEKNGSKAEQLKDYEKIILDFHERAKWLQVDGNDFREEIDKFQNIASGDVLFYADSPYLGTEDYNQKNDVASFKSSDMKDLIIKLMDSEQMFIFSCRAAQEKAKNMSMTCVIKDVDEKNNTIYKIDRNKLKEAIRYRDSLNDLSRDANYVIRENVFLTFLEESISRKIALYVLAIIPNNHSSLSEVIKAKKISEIMITNYEIHSFVDTTYNFRYIAYSFEQFLGELLSI